MYLPAPRAEGMASMNSFSVDSESGMESELMDLDAVPFSTLRELDSEALRHSLRQVVERTRHVRTGYRSNNASAGERID